MVFAELHLVKELFSEITNIVDAPRRSRKKVGIVPEGQYSSSSYLWLGWQPMLRPEKVRIARIFRPCPLTIATQTMYEYDVKEGCIFWLMNNIETELS